MLRAVLDASDGCGDEMRVTCASSTIALETREAHQRFAACCCNTLRAARFGGISLRSCFRRVSSKTAPRSSTPRDSDSTLRTSVRGHLLLTAEAATCTIATSALPRLTGEQRRRQHRHAKRSAISACASRVLRRDCCRGWARRCTDPAQRPTQPELPQCEGREPPLPQRLVKIDRRELCAEARDARVRCDTHVPGLRSLATVSPAVQPAPCGSSNQPWILWRVRRVRPRLVRTGKSGRPARLQSGAAKPAQRATRVTHAS